MDSQYSIVSKWVHHKVVLHSSKKAKRLRELYFDCYCMSRISYSPPPSSQENQVLPDRIIVFRDGVGDGQMKTVAEHEVPQILSCFSMFGKESCTLVSAGR